MTDAITIRRAYADTPYGQLHYRHAGEGEPLLLIHQTATSSYAYEPVMAYLASSCRVIAVDTPGYGMSDYPTNREYTAADYARTFAAFLRACRCVSRNGGQADRGRHAVLGRPDR